MSELGSTGSNHSINRHRVKERRKLKDGDNQNGLHSLSSSNNNNNEWRSKYELAVAVQQRTVSPHDADMEDILSPTFDDDDGGNNFSAREESRQVAHSYSADSIIRRVEEEIAAARKAATDHLSPMSMQQFQQRQQLQRQKQQQQSNTDDDDMANILNTDTFESNANYDAGDGSYRINGQHSASTDSSQNRKEVMDLISDEFKSSGTPTATTDSAHNQKSSSNCSFRDDEMHNSDTPSDEGEKGVPKDEKKMEDFKWEQTSPTRRSQQRESSLPNRFSPRSPSHASKKSNLIHQTTPRAQNFPQRASSSSQTMSPSSTNRLTSSASQRQPLSPQQYHAPPLSPKLVASPNTTERVTSPSRSDPDGVYKTSPSPPRKDEDNINGDGDDSNASISQESNSVYFDSSQQQHQSPLSPLASSSNNRTPSRSMTAASPLASSATPVTMSRTRELLESLKVQREGLVAGPRAATREVDANAGATSTTTSPTHLNFRGNERVTRSGRCVDSQPGDTDGHHGDELMQGESQGLVSTGVPNDAGGAKALSPTRLSVKEVTPESPSKSNNSRTLTGQDGKVGRLVHAPEEKKVGTPSRGSRNTKSSRHSNRSSLREDSKRRAGTSDLAEEGGVSNQSRRIRFRNPFPLMKSPLVRRDIGAIIEDHAIGMPELPVRWVKPKKELKQLIVAAMGTSLARRSNACGALKVLTRHKKNQLTLVRTDGFLSALIFAAGQPISEFDRDLALDSRTRAVTCLKNVCSPKDNRALIFHHPGVVDVLVKVVDVDAGEGRAMSAAAIALLAKTPGCREGLVQVESLIEVLSRVMYAGDSYVSPETLKLRNTPRSKKMDDSNSEFSLRTSGDDDDEDEASILSDDASGSSNDLPMSGLISPTASSSVKDTATIHSNSSIRNQSEERQEEFVYQARSNACAALMHMSKQCAISHLLCTNDVFLYGVAKVARETSNPIHSHCLEIICNLTRFAANNNILARYDGILETLVLASNSTPAVNRISSLRSLQNMSADPLSKALLATGPVLNLMTSCAMRKDLNEKEVAVATIYNITTEPSAVTAITNTKNVVATLVHLAHSPDSSSDVRLLACEALATISLWLQTLAGTGKVPDGVPNVPLPSQKTSGWERWD